MEKEIFITDPVHLVHQPYYIVLVVVKPLFLWPDMAFQVF